MSAQFQLLQDSFAPFNFNLKLAETRWIVNESLASVNKGDDHENVVKQALRKGTYADLNLFYIAYLTVGIGNEGTGWSTWPWGSGNWSPNSTIEPTEFDKSIDGCFVNSATVPNGTNDWGYNQGKIAVHEAGHWFGLYHVFEGGCSGPGDYVNDTFPQGSYTFTRAGVCDDIRPGCFLGTDPPNYKNHSKQPPTTQTVLQGCQGLALWKHQLPANFSGHNVYFWNGAVMCVEKYADFDCFCSGLF